jgi:hypothetical protein
MNRNVCVVFDCDEAHVYGRNTDGSVNYDVELPWPADWPQWITGEFLRLRGIPWCAA